MIITRHWLNEWIDISNTTTEVMCKTFNAIGLEVDSVVEHRMPENVVVGKVLSKEKHPDAQKLNVCQVYVGNETHQIVCGAKNVDAGQLVPVAVVGAVLPGDFKIKPAKLRGVESNGMICSSTELGLPKINDGIMVLDDSLGKFKIGTPLKDIELLNDDVIELELTANRGDCLSIYGVARDLSVALDLELKDITSIDEDENLLGIGRVLSIHAEDKIDSSFIYKTFSFENLNENVLMDLRLATVDTEFSTNVEKLLQYTTYSTGVLMRGYDHSCFVEKGAEKALVSIRKDTNEIDAVYNGENRVAYVGVYQEDICKVTNKTKTVIVEANYTPPEEISKSSAKNKSLTSDRHLYRSTRGSEPDLEFGMNYFQALLGKKKGVSIYAGSQLITKAKEEKTVSIDIADLNNMIGQEIPKNRVVQILKKLGFDVFFKAEQDTLNVKVPFFRHDIVNEQDLCEEIVRIVGIDNIKSKQLVFAEKSRINTSYIDFEKRKNLRYKAVSAGFFESIHYVFDDIKLIEKYGFRSIYKSKALSNPITGELNTLRSTLLFHLIEAASHNVKNGRRSVPLFEIGRVFGPNREESVKLGFIFSGEVSSQSVLNHGKPEQIDLMTFASKISSVVGSIELESMIPTTTFVSPYECATVKLNGKKIGYLARVHAEVEKEFGIPKTYICELDFDDLPYGRKIAENYSKFPSSTRDLSLKVPKSMKYSEIRKCIDSISPNELVRFLPIDIYENEKLGDFISLTIKLVFQDKNGTLEDEKVTTMVEELLAKLQEKLGITL